MAPCRPGRFLHSTLCMLALAACLVPASSSSSMAASDGASMAPVSQGELDSLPRLLAELGLGEDDAPGAYGAAYGGAMTPSALRSAGEGAAPRSEAFEGAPLQQRGAEQQQQTQTQQAGGAPAGHVAGAVVGCSLAAAAVVLGVGAWRRRRARHAPRNAPDYIARYRRYEGVELS